MCRYAIHPNYRTHFACFSCRKAWKAYEAEVCPSCAGPAIRMGNDFHAPRKGNVNQWRKLELLHAQGVHFESRCGCDGPGRRPRTLADAKRVAPSAAALAALRGPNPPIAKIDRSLLVERR